MKVCTKCGKVSDSKFCPDCGSPMQEKATTEQPRNSVQVSSDEKSQGGVYVSEHIGEQGKGEVKLGWHKWLVNFVFWLWAVMDVMNAAGNFMLGGAFILLGLVYVALAVGDIYIRFQIAGFKQGAIKKFQTFMYITIAVSVIDAISWTAMGGSINATGIAMSLVWLTCNMRYYSSREHLFVN